MDYFIPTTCNATANYNAFELGYNIRYGFGCCSDENLCNDNYFSPASAASGTTCSDTSSIGSYVDGMASCWTDIQAELATYNWYWFNYIYK